jgi:hypothetical protein
MPFGRIKGTGEPLDLASMILCCRLHRLSLCKRH